MEKKMAKQIQELDYSQLKFRCDPSLFKFTSTKDIPIEDHIYGQDRACKAIDFGVGIKSFGYNIFVLGPAGSGKTTAVRRALALKAKSRPTPSDWVYVNNFEDSSLPLVLQLPTETGTQLRDNMQALVDELKVQIPQAFENEHYQDQRKHLTDGLEEKRQEQLKNLADFAAERNFELKNMGRGFAMIPIKDGVQLKPEEFELLPEEEKNAIEKSMHEIQEEAEKIMENVQDLEEKIGERVNDLNRRIADMAVGRSIGKMKKKYADHPGVIKYLNNVKEDILQNVHDFIPEPEPPQGAPPSMALFGQREPDFTRYQVTLLVSNKKDTGAPVVFENNPTFYNLIGKTEHKPTQSGALITDFSMIKPGSLHIANGGYIIIEVNELLKNVMAYDALKRCLKNREVVLEDLNEQYKLVATTGLKPQPVPLDIKVVLIGSPWAYYMLYTYDEDFKNLFKVKADFGYEMDRTDKSIDELASFAATLVARDGLMHFSPDAIAEVAEFSSRLVEDNRKLATSFSMIADVLRESSYWAGQNGNSVVVRADVVRAIDEKEYRSNRIEEKLQEMIEDGSIMVSTDDRVVGQVNGLAVLAYGDFTFGKPSRITARHFAGKSGVINVEREVKMSGRIHDKGVMILASFIRSKFGAIKPPSFSASLTFEQVYEEVDGDSASSTELYAILSSLSGVPIYQGYAVTGSVNQFGEIQPIGGVNYKIEGFFALCKSRGLTGEQGVMIPHQNVKNLNLEDEIVEAVKEGKFHIWPVHTIDEGIEILTGKPAGKQKRDGTYPKHSVYGKVVETLEELAKHDEDSASSRVSSPTRGVKI
jgi:lon-related putative ATP-dependent protease